jgi:hypothetical protein
MTARPDFSLEAALGGRVAGVDEAGRGPLAGPVLAAALLSVAQVYSGVTLTGFSSALLAAALLATGSLATMLVVGRRCTTPGRLGARVVVTASLLLLLLLCPRQLARPKATRLAKLRHMPRHVPRRLALRAPPLVALLVLAL